MLLFDIPLNPLPSSIADFVPSGVAKSSKRVNFGTYIAKACGFLTAHDAKDPGIENVTFCLLVATTKCSNVLLIELRQSDRNTEVSTFHLRYWQNQNNEDRSDSDSKSSFDTNAKWKSTKKLLLRIKLRYMVKNINMNLLHQSKDKEQK